MSMNGGCRARPDTLWPCRRSMPTKCGNCSTSPASPKFQPASTWNTLRRNRKPRPRRYPSLFGFMDWLPNVDGMIYFVREILPIIHRTRPETTLAIVGRTPPPEIVELGKQDPRIVVTGTVPDIRPHVWGSELSVVPLRIGGGTRLKIYESMAARVPVVSTTIGAEGLEINPPDYIRLADTPEAFAAECLELLSNEKTRRNIANAAAHGIHPVFVGQRLALL